jgi:bifunctional DNA-binding transcriptional regulator/antitoxin component of YhaV-PrlF toxin-antitoxin module
LKFKGGKMTKIKRIVYLGSSGQLTIPKAVRKAFGYENTYLLIVATKESMVIKKIEVEE